MIIWLNDTFGAGLGLGIGMNERAGLNPGLDGDSTYGQPPDGGPAETETGIIGGQRLGALPHPVITIAP
ncbi:hypothetical protein ACIO8F_29580 [Streptomyces sp. NPDC087228]|uniref:hypothetical protein n=1 Tax=Streptomyces sp. NPDC087228 TaxID=3365772 RepID=UPI003811BE57